MMASNAGKVECVRILLDRGAKVNMQKKVSGVIIHCVQEMQHIPRAPPVVDDEMRTGTRIRTCLSCYLISATSNRHTSENAHKLYN